MPSKIVKTAISIQKPLFEQAELLAQQLNISRSHLFGIALEKFIAHYNNQSLLEEINSAYDKDLPNSNDDILLSKMRKLHKKMVEDEW
ncbi:MAG: CopG family transcriptional regulator [Desulfamplus sp.]|nr:CopG family transcriptional regulator [Desulfamplus sp.]MBF0390725.1 CopG family transcriptional regulator [Desulfamplus sp.]